MENSEMLKVLNKALEMEEKGYNFYNEMSMSAKNIITKEAFSFLADQETLHIESIRNFYDSLAKDKPRLIKFEDVAKTRDDEITIFSKKITDLKEKITPDDSDTKACEFAMEFENNGYKYYENVLKYAKDESLIALLKFLLREEAKHYDAISKLHTYITDSSNWHMYEEGSFPQG
ncbi:MAG: ferritin family protein [Candidatus Omnitrophota bacterium]